jgi:thiol-disulfide isomerase/thioredoxin
MEKGKGVASLIVTGALVIILAVASLVYPKISAWYENMVNGGNEVTGSPALNGSQQGTGTPQQNGNQQNNAAEPVTVTDVPLAAPNGDNGAKDFYIVKSDGTTARLSDFYGKPLVVNIWATWCGYCKEEFPFFDAALKTYGDRVEFMFVDLCDGRQETRAKADKYMASKGCSFPVYYETLDKVLDTYNDGGIPLTLFINPDGTIFKKRIGAFSGQIGLFDMIDRLLANSMK